MEGSQLVMNSRLPAGFRFHPTDQELIHYYLSKKVTGSLPPDWDIIADIDLYKFNPWELPEKAFFGEREWFFFSPRDRKYPNGVRPNRAAASGYWKATGTDKPILAAGGTQCIGVKKALVFYMGRPPKGTKTEWIMHEYRLLNSMSVASQSQKKNGSMRLDDWVLCQVRQKANLPAVSDEVVKTCSPPLSIFSFSTQNEVVTKNTVMNRTSLTEWSDNQILTDLMESYARSESTMEDLSPACYMTNSHHAAADDNIREAQQLSSTQSMEPVLGFMKRKLPFVFNDELIFLQHGKRLKCSVDWLFPPTEQISINHSFPESFI